MIWTFNHRGIINLDFLGGKIFFYYAYDYWLKVGRKHLIPRLINESCGFFGMKRYFFITYTDRRSKIGKNYLILGLITNFVDFLGWKDIDIFLLYIRIEDRK